MPTQVVDAPIVDSKFDEDVTVPANNAAATVQRLYNAYHGYREVLISTAATAEMGIALPPRIAALLFYDSSAGTYTDLLGGDNGLIDRSTTGTTGTSFDSMTLSDRIFVGCRRKYRGLWLEIEAANGTAATLAARYSKDDATFADLTETDGTASGGATFAVDGNLTWTVPADWGAETLGAIMNGERLTGTAQASAATTLVLAAATSLNDGDLVNWTAYITGGTGAGQKRTITAYTGATDTATVAAWDTTPDTTSTYEIVPPDPPFASAPLYWVELKVSATIGADVSWDVAGALAQTAADAQGINLKVSTEYTFDISDDVGGVEVTATSTTATTADITWIKR